MNQQELSNSIESWLQDPSIDAQSREEIKKLRQQNNWDELSDRFYRDLEFGTGGMRGVLGAGRNRMNVYNIQKATSALGSYLQEVFPHLNPIKVAISYDSRHYSKDFAQAACEVLANMGIHCYITEKLRPVPMLSFMVRHFQCQAGICITASHNPPQYNGFKVYFDDGGQIVPPHDAALVKRYKNTEGPIKITAFAEGMKKKMIHMVGEDFDQIYIDKVRSLSLQPQARPPFLIIYSPLHGSGRDPMLKALHAFGFDNVRLVAEQAEADGRFPTVKSPNPEDREALAMGLNDLKKYAGDILIATDPDCDRLALATRDAKGQIDHFNGNEMGALLIDYVLASKKKKGILPDRAIVLKTIVTTELQRDIALHYGCHIDETLTGFKWIAAKIKEFESLPKNKQFIYQCGGEESYGFLAGDFVRDKDGVIAGALACEMVAFYKSQGKTLRQVLMGIHERHGYYLDHLVTKTLGGQAGAMKIQATMERLRREPPSEIANIKVKSMNDFQTGKSFTRAGHEFIPAGTLTLPPSNVLQFTLEDGSRISARPSGTEPKIKFYFSIRQELAVQKDAKSERNSVNYESSQQQAQEKLDAFVGFFNTYLS